jgi:hypothetical protein
LNTNKQEKRKPSFMLLYLISTNLIGLALFVYDFLFAKSVFATIMLAYWGIVLSVQLYLVFLAGKKSEDNHGYGSLEKAYQKISAKNSEAAISGICMVYHDSISFNSSNYRHASLWRYRGEDVVVRMADDGLMVFDLGGRFICKATDWFKNYLAEQAKEKNHVLP